MKETIKKIGAACSRQHTRFSFGSTSALVTILGLITGLDTGVNAKANIIGGILIIAIADNISDSLGIHIFQESECVNYKEVWISTFTNFFTRLLVSLSFVVLIAMLPLGTGVIISIAWGIFLLSIISVMIARSRKINPVSALLEHLGIALAVILISHYLSIWIRYSF